jgi:hypothetical protein
VVSSDVVVVAHRPALRLPRLELTSPSIAPVRPADAPHPPAPDRAQRDISPLVAAADAVGPSQAATPATRTIQSTSALAETAPIRAQLVRDRTRIVVMMVFAIVCILAVAVAFEAQLEGFTF